MGISHVTGLSPRVRGNLLEESAGRANRGSIPACAGEPLEQVAANGSEAVYPRVCGGTHCGRRWRHCMRGLSPRVRGNRFHRASPRLFSGSIPACAGEPSVALFTTRLHGVYPRVCGGTTGVSFHRSGYSGLSPRVRGNRRRCGRTKKGLRSIPACAGEPRIPRCRRSRYGSIPACAGEP